MLSGGGLSRVSGDPSSAAFALDGAGAGYRSRNILCFAFCCFAFCLRTLNRRSPSINDKIETKDPSTPVSRAGESAREPSSTQDAGSSFLWEQESKWLKMTSPEKGSLSHRSPRHRQ